MVISKRLGGEDCLEGGEHLVGYCESEGYVDQRGGAL